MPFALGKPDGSFEMMPVDRRSNNARDNNGSKKQQAKTLEKRRNCGPCKTTNVPSKYWCGTCKMCRICSQKSIIICGRIFVTACGCP
ncbi:hypothetical protein BGZ47_009695 [Haplosporangium gracile]|nr:hypothetical protein BGZ47_009695 [Haplosporangium gracile]